MPGLNPLRAVGLGGALYNAGAWEITNTVFLENTAGGGGLAVYDEGSSLALWNDTFRGNAFSCPSDQYSDAHYVRTNMIRFSLAKELNVITAKKQSRWMTGCMRSFFTGVSVCDGRVPKRCS